MRGYVKQSISPFLSYFESKLDEYYDLLSGSMLFDELESIYQDLDEEVKNLENRIMELEEEVKELREQQKSAQ